MKKVDTNSWIIEVQQDDETKELFIEIPPEALAQVGWDFGDILVWEEMSGSKSFALRKKTDTKDEDDPLEGMEETGC